MTRFSDPDTVLVQVKVPREIAKALKVYAAQNDTSIQQIGNELYEAFVREHGTLPESQLVTRERRAS